MSDVSVVILTMGDRPVPLKTSIESVRRQQKVDAEIVLVVNGGEPDSAEAHIVVAPGENLGIPKGRNVGLVASSADFVAFLDDDGWYPSDDVLRQALQTFETEPDVAVIGLRIIDQHGGTARRHHPRLWGDHTRSGDVTSFPGGACIVRRRAFEAVGGLCEEFFYGLEETDLAWRLLNEGWTIRYSAEITMGHPRIDPARHDGYHFHTARNRVWLAHRTLPLPLAATYVTVWFVVTALRNLRSPTGLRSYAAGTRAGIRSPAGPRAPMRWRTVAAMTRLGRPPII